MIYLTKVDAIFATKLPGFLIFYTPYREGGDSARFIHRNVLAFVIQHTRDHIPG